MAAPNGFETPVNQLVTPAGTLVELPGLRPLALALSPDGKLLVTAGLTHELVAVDPATGKILQRVPLPSDKTQDRRRSPPNSFRRTKKRRSVLPVSFFRLMARGFICRTSTATSRFSASSRPNRPAFSIPLPPANAPDRTDEIPAGIAVSPDGKKIYVALNLSNRLAELDAATGRVLRIWDVGVAPFDVVLAGRKIYVSNWGGRRPDADSVTGPAGRGTLVRVDSRSIASEGSVSVIDFDPNLAKSAAMTPRLPKSSPACTPARWRCRRTDAGSLWPTPAATR